MAEGAEAEAEVIHMQIIMHTPKANVKALALHILKLMKLVLQVMIPVQLILLFVRTLIALMMYI